MVTCAVEGDPIATTGLLRSETAPVIGASHGMLSSGCLKHSLAILLLGNIWIEVSKLPGELIPSRVLSKIG